MGESSHNDGTGSQEKGASRNKWLPFAVAGAGIVVVIVLAVAVLRPGDGTKAPADEKGGPVETPAKEPAGERRKPAAEVEEEAEEPAEPRDPDFLSPVALARDSGGTTLFIAEAAAHQIAVFDVAEGKVAKVFPLRGRPSGVALSADGARLYVTRSRRRVDILEASSGKKIGSLRAGNAPTAPILSPDGGTLYVCNRFDNNVAVIDLGSGKTAAVIPVLREPVAAAISRDGKLLFVGNHLPAGPADSDYAAAAVSVIDCAARKVAATIELPNGSTGLKGVCVSPDGRHAYVAHILARYLLPTTQLERGWMNTNALSVISVAARKRINTVLLDDVDLGAANPWGVACTADGKYVCVTIAGTHELAVIDREGLHRKLLHGDEKKEPGYSVPTSPGAPAGAERLSNWEISGPYTGGDVFQTAYPPEKGDGSGAKWRRLKVGGNTPWIVDFMSIPGVAGDNRAVYLRTELSSPKKQSVTLHLGSDDGIKAWLNGKLVHSNNTSRGHVEGQDKAKATLEKGRNRLLLKITNGGGGWGASASVATRDGSKLGEPKPEGPAKAEGPARVELPAEEKPTISPKEVANIQNDLSFLVGLKRRLRLKGNGPRGLVVVGSKAYAAEYFSDSVGVIDISPDVRPKAKSVPLGPKKELTAVRRGEMLFSDAVICFQKWQSCASCHPDGRSDGLNWDLLNDGIGNPKNTKSLLLTHRTPPVMITGVRDRAEAAVRAGIRHILFAVRPEEDAVAIDEYLKSMKPFPSPYLKRGKPSEAAERGKALFAKAGCASCHKAPLYTDLKKYDVGAGVGSEKDKAFDTPSLVEVWRSAPYLYDGRAATMKEVLTKHNPQDKHGATSGLKENEIADLAEFVMSR